jgi:hypothetical protein
MGEAASFPLLSRSSIPFLIPNLSTTSLLTVFTLIGEPSHYRTIFCSRMER